jgi:ribonuclease HIII
VACASIIARYSIIKRRDTLSKKIGLELPKGAGIQVDVVAKKLYEEKGPKALEKIAKLNFKNYKKILPLNK